VEVLLDNLERRYRIDGQEAPAANVARLRPAFGPQRAVRVTDADWNVYVDHHQRATEDRRPRARKWTMPPWTHAVERRPPQR
jgi:hypothetical protein